MIKKIEENLKIKSLISFEEDLIIKDDCNENIY